MRILRHTVVQRLFSVGLLMSLALWLAAPATGAAAAERTLAAQADWIGTQAPTTVEAAFSEAVAIAASQGMRTPEAFAAAFSDALAARPDPALAHFLEHAGADALLAVLYGHLLRAFSHHNGLEAAPTPPVATPAGASPCAFARLERAPSAALPPSIEPVRSAFAPPLPSVAERSAAQPLGP